jgi:hypothetical protein
MDHNRAAYPSPPTYDPQLEQPERVSSPAEAWLRYAMGGDRAQRPRVLRAKRTNHPLVPPRGLSLTEGRRWRDLCRFYGVKLGAQRLADEAVRARLLHLLWTTLQLERLRDAPLSPAEHSAAHAYALYVRMHLAQEQRGLLHDLGLSEREQQNGRGAQNGAGAQQGAQPDAGPTLREYLHANQGAPPGQDPEAAT